MQKRKPTLAIDGCPGGWVAWVVGGAVREPTMVVASSLDALVREATCVGGEAPALIAVDMPLLRPGEENADASERYAAWARSMLPGCTSRVFSPLSPAVLACDAYASASAASRSATGKGLSKQAWNLAPKVREVRACAQRVGACTVMLEVHPEVCFAQLCGGPVRESKKTAEGLARRERALCERTRAWASVWKSVRREGLPKAKHGPRPACDDVLDAAAVLIVATSELLDSHARAQGVASVRDCSER
jgi:predicted RNase H-like nuclease